MLYDKMKINIKQHFFVPKTLCVKYEAVSFGNDVVSRFRLGSEAIREPE